MWFAGSVQLFKYIQSSRFSRSYKLPFKSTGSNLITSPDIGHLKSCGSYACYYNSIFLYKKEVMLREWSNIEYFKKMDLRIFFYKLNLSFGNIQNSLRRWMETIIIKIIAHNLKFIFVFEWSVYFSCTIMLLFNNLFSTFFVLICAQSLSTLLSLFYVHS